MPTELLLDDIPEASKAVQAEQQSITKTDETITKVLPVAPALVPKQLDQTSIVDTLLSKGVAMVMDDEPTKQSPEAKEAPKVRPYDGTDPYREPAE